MPDVGPCRPSSDATGVQTPLAARRPRRLTVVQRALLTLGVALGVPSGSGVLAATRASRPALTAARASRPALTAGAFDLITPATLQGSTTIADPAFPPPAARSATTPAPTAPASAETSPVTVVRTPAPSDPTTTAGPTTTGAAVRWPPGVEAMVAIPSLGIDLPVVEGGQAVIDEGVVAHYDGPGWLPPTPAGAVGTYWLAAHHVTHGSPFERLPSIRAGAPVMVITPRGTYTYSVTSLQVVGSAASYATVYGAQPTARLILLQTCLGATERLLVHGVLSATN